MQLFHNPSLLRFLSSRRLNPDIFLSGETGEHFIRKTGEQGAKTDVRPYFPGDELRLINWRLSARTEHIWVNRRNHYVKQSFFFWSDYSKSMEVIPEKKKMRDELSASLAFIAVQQDKLFLPLDSGVFAPRNTSELRDRLAAHISQSGALPSKKWLSEIRNRTKGKIHLFLFADLYIPFREFDTFLQALSRQNFILNFFHIVTPSEEHVHQRKKQIRWKDAEDGSIVQGSEVVYEKIYREAVDKRIKLIHSRGHFIHQINAREELKSIISRITEKTS